MPRLRPHGAATGPLTNAQRETLLFGDAILPPMPGERLFTTDAEAATAWRTNRRALLATFDQPGRRPWAFWRFDLQMDAVPGEWWQQAADLERLGLMDRAEEIRLERDRRELATEQGELYEALFAGHHWGDYMLRQFRAEFEFAAGWHGRRGRMELEDKYRRLAQAAEREAICKRK